MPCTALHKCFPDGRPEIQVSCGYQELEKQACLGQGTCKAELSDASVFLVTGFDHCQADHAQGNHVHEDLLVKPDWGAAVPGGAPEGLLKVAIESLNVPTHTIETGQISCWGNKYGPKARLPDVDGGNHLYLRKLP